MMDDSFNSLPELTNFTDLSFQRHRKPPVLSPQQYNQDWINAGCNQLNSSLFEDASKDNNNANDQIIPDVPETVKTKGLLFCHQNMNSIRNKFEELVWFVLCFNPLLFAVTESKLDAIRDTDGMYTISDYVAVRKDRSENEGGGTIIYLRNSVKFEEVDWLSCISKKVKVPKFCEITVLKIKLTGVKPIFVVIIYKPPTVSTSEFVKVFYEVCKIISQDGNEIVVLGDFNINVLPNRISNKEHVICNDSFELFKVCKEFDFWQLMNEPTHDKGALLDHVYVNYKELYATFGCFPFAGSDHNLCFTVRKKVKSHFKPRVINVRKWKDVDWEKVRAELSLFPKTLSENSTNNIYYNRAIDDKFHSLNNYMLSIIDKHAPEKKMLVKGKKNPWFTSDVMKQIKLRNRKHKIALKSRDECDWKNYRIERNKKNIMASKAKKVYYRGKFEENCKSESMWDTIDSLTNFRSKATQKISYLEIGKRRVYEDKEINDILADAFVVKDAQVDDLELLHSEVENYCENYDYADSETWDIEPIVVSKGKIGTIVKNMKVKKSHNPKNVVSLKMMRACSTVFCSLLTWLISEIIATRSVPTIFKKANIIPLYKGKGSRNVASNYRPISLLTDFCKIFEKFLAERIQTRVESQLCDKQHAYRKKRSCHTALKELTNDIFKSIDNPSTKVGAVFIDFSKAFDSIEQSLLIRKLMNEYKLEPWYVKTMLANTKNRIFNVSGSDKCYPLSRGISQGSANAPLSFSLYINSISKVITCKYQMYADDIIIYTEGKTLNEINEKLQFEVDKILDWCEANCMKINFEKTKCMYFHKAKDYTIKKENHITEIKVREYLIQRVFSFKYLGIILDCTLSFKLHYENVLNKLSNKIRYLRGFKRYLNKRVFKVMVNAHIHSVIEYGIDIWAVLTDEQLDVIQRKIDRFLAEVMYPTYKRKRKGSCDYAEIRKEFEFFSIQQRRDYVVLKGVYRDIKDDILEICKQSIFNDIPRIKIPKFKSETYRKSLDYRGAVLWNKLPKSLKVGEISYDKFKLILKENLLQN